MQIRNTTKMEAAYTLGMRPDGRELVVVVVKGTFAFPARAGELPKLLTEQPPLTMADEFAGEPGYSSTLIEADFVPEKPNAEVLLIGTAHAPEGKPTNQLLVSLRVGELQKQIQVVGDRTWRGTLSRPQITPPAEFTQMPLGYERAFGGIDASDLETGSVVYDANPIGRGFVARSKNEALVNQPLPNLEEPGRPVVDPRRDYRPMSFGPIGRAWKPRRDYAGTYDADWKANQFPFLPTDFDERYYQSAPEDQQLPSLVGGEQVELTNLTPEGLCRFQLPTIAVPIEFHLQDATIETRNARLDTLHIDADQRQFSMVWRTSYLIVRDIFELNLALVGRMPRAWYRARELGKKYYDNLSELAAEKI
ncbi:MAG: DUF2169 domain-containing protein [Pirellulaceae bacterium]